MKNLFVLLVSFLFITFLFQSFQGKTDVLKINTSNAGKLEEYKRLFSHHGIVLEVSEHDLDEIDADPLSVIVHKASQMDEGVLAEDTSLAVEGADIGVNIRWLVDDLDKYQNRKATWTVFLAYRLKNDVHVYKGEVEGKIVLYSDNYLGRMTTIIMAGFVSL